MQITFISNKNREIQTLLLVFPSFPHFLIFFHAVQTYFCILKVTRSHICLMILIFSLNVYALDIKSCYAIFKRIILMATENFIECIPQDSLNHLLLDIEIVFKHFSINALSNKHFEHEQFSSFMCSMPFGWDIYHGIIELQHVAFLWLLIEVGKILYGTLCSVTVFIWHCSGTISPYPHPRWT